MKPNWFLLKNISMLVALILFFTVLQVVTKHIFCDHTPCGEVCK